MRFFFIVVHLGLERHSSYEPSFLDAKYTILTDAKVLYWNELHRGVTNGTGSVTNGERAPVRGSIIRE
jgi:hypothetical protein